MPKVLDDLKNRAEQAARELDEKYKIRSKFDEGAKVATDALKKGVDVAASGIDKARDEVTRIDREHGISEKVTDGFKQAASTADKVWTDSGAKAKTGEFVDDAKTAASDLFGEAKNYYRDASEAARATASATRLPSSVISAVKSGRRWMKENPGKAAAVSLAFVAGTQAGSAFTSLDVALLGAGGAGSWLFHSAIVPYGLRKLTEKYESNLKRREILLAEGKLSDAERTRVQFERDIAKYVGAPLLGSFSIAMGAGLMYEAVTGAAVTGLPINLLIGGNPLLTSIWFFGNGLICFHNGYKFFMMALADQEEVARVVRDIKGLLPA
ncbi:MAG TPA: hypothetical protein VFV34_28690 [Blastocatellia bacterium]|nr:hypothetical protein [Blastocatellia bacterium]